MERQPRVFISRTTAGLKDVADEIAVILRERGFAAIIQTGFLPDWRSVPQMLQDKLHSCDSVIALVGPAHGGGPDSEPARLRDASTHGHRFSFTQWEFLVARDLSRPLFTFILRGPGLVAAFEKESVEREQLQQQFIADFAKDRTTLYYEYTDRTLLLDHIRRMEIPINVSAGLPQNLPYTTLGPLFKGRAQFLADLHPQLTSEKATGIRGRKVIHGMGGVGKTRTAVEYAWAHASDYRALLFVVADSYDSLQRNLAALCGPLVLNLPEQDSSKTDVQISAVLRWFNQNSGWLLIIDNADTVEAQDSVVQLFGSLSEGHIIITSRIADWPAGVTALDLDLLDELSSIAFLLERTAGRRIPHDEDSATAAIIARMLDCLALALEQSAAYIRHRRCTLTDYVANWESNRPAVLDWHDPVKSQYALSLAITFHTSVAQLSDDARQLFHILSWLAPDPIPLAAIEHLRALAYPRALLIELADLHLARLRADGTNATVHRLLQEITRQQQTDPKPQALLIALDWISEEMPLVTTDVRTWPSAVPLAPHAIAAATFAADHDILEPSGWILNTTAALMNAQARNHIAEPLYRRALAMIGKARGGNDPIVGVCLNNLAQLLKDTNRLAEAEPLMRRVLAIWTLAYGETDPNVAVALNNLANLLSKTNRLADAEPLMRRALAIDEVCLGSDHPHVARDLNNLSELLRSTNRFAETEPLIRRALSIQEGSYGKEHPNVAISLNNLALLLQDTDRLADAEPLMRRALAIDEASYGSEHPNVSIRLSNLALLLKETNRLAEAEPLIRRALAIDEAILGNEHPTIAIRLCNLASLLQDTNRLAEAEPLMRRALAIDEASLGHDHPRVANDLNNLATLLTETECFVEAESFILRALAIDEATYGGAHPNVAIRLNNLAQLLKATNRFAEAEPLMRQALAIDEANLGNQHPRVASDLNNLARLLQATGRLAEAEPLMRRALAIDEASLGHKHPKVARYLINLATLLKETESFAEAEALIRRALAIDEANHGNDHPAVAGDLNDLAALLRLSNRLLEAEALMRRALMIDEADLGNEHPNVAFSLNRLAQLLQDSGRLTEAESLMHRVVEILLKCTRDSGRRHPGLMIVLDNYAILLLEMGETEAEVIKKIGTMLSAYGVTL